MDDWLTVTDIEKKTGIPDATVRRYIRNHGHNFKIKKKGKSYLVASDSVELMKTIREWYAEGKQAEQVEDKLSKSGIPMTITVTDDEQNVTVQVTEYLQQQNEAMQDMRKNMAEMNEKYNALMEAFKLQQEYIDRKLEARDQKLIEALRENLETKKQIASSEQENTEKKKGFFSRFFK